MEDVRGRLPALTPAAGVVGDDTSTVRRLRNVGMICVTDDVLSPNPWDALAIYWLSELGSLQRLP